MALDHRKTQKGQELPNFTEDEARSFFEAERWPTGAVCPHCESQGCHLMRGKRHRVGLWHCSNCEGQFTVTMGTVMEDSHLPLSKWAMAFHLMATSKKGVSALQLQRQLGLGSYKTAWYLAHRIRLAMKPDAETEALFEGIVEADETYVGGKPRHGDGKPHKKGRGTDKAAVTVLVERGGRAMSRHVTNISAENLQMALIENVHPDAAIYTDEFSSYRGVGQHFKGGHHTVNHSKKQYARKGGINSNSAESYFALLKRGVVGTFHSISKKHLHRYCNEFDFRWSGRKLEDVERRNKAIKGAQGRRMTFKAPTAKVEG